MSLINEALKRTRANLKNPRGPGSDAGMHPVEGAPASRRRWGLAALAVCLLGLAGLFLAKPWDKKPDPAAKARASPAAGKNIVRQADPSPGGGRLAAGVATLASAQALATSRTQAFSNLSAVVEAPAPGARARQSAPRRGPNGNSSRGFRPSRGPARLIRSSRHRLLQTPVPGSEAARDFFSILKSLGADQFPNGVPGRKGPGRQSREHRAGACDGGVERPNPSVDVSIRSR